MRLKGPEDGKEIASDEPVVRRNHLSERLRLRTSRKRQNRKVIGQGVTSS